MNNYDFWEARKINDEVGMPQAEEEQIIEAKDMTGAASAEYLKTELLFDIKEQLRMLNVTFATIGEMLGEYFYETLKAKENDNGKN